MKKGWIKGWISGTPHFIIGGNNPYLYRWYIIPRNRWFNIYLHKFLRDDDDRALHDHPWWFTSIMIKGSYCEIISDKMTAQERIIRRSLSFAFRKALHRHRVELLRDQFNNPKPCWTLLITGKVVRNWGFWCPQGFIRWQDFTAPTDVGQVGRGCD